MFPLHSFRVLFHSIKSNGTSSLGSGIGTFLLAPAVQLLIEYYSWRGALLILGAFVSNLCVCGALMRPLEPRGSQRYVLGYFGVFYLDMKEICCKSKTTES